MANERKTDFFINGLLQNVGIQCTPNSSNIKEVQDALKSASKKGTGNTGFPDLVGLSNNFLIVIEDKPALQKQAKYSDDQQTVLCDKVESIVNYAENGALHYAKVIIAKTGFKQIFAFGCSGDEKHHKIRPIYVDETGYKLMREVENFENFSAQNINKYYHEQVLGEIPVEAIELEEILNKSKELHEALRNYGQLGDSEKPLVVSAILLALCEEDRKSVV